MNVRYAAVIAGLLAGATGFWAGQRHGRTSAGEEVAQLRVALVRAEAGQRPPAGAGSQQTGSSEGGGGALPEQAQAQSLPELMQSLRGQLTDGMMNIGRIVEVVELMRGIDLEAMPEALRLIREMPNFEQKNILYMAALTRWADEDGAGAADYVSGNIEGELKAGMLGAVFSSWAAREPLAAWDWFENHRNEFANPGHEHPLVRSLFQGLAARDFPAAMERLKGLGEFDFQVMALEAIGTEAANNPGQRTAFLEYALALENQPQRMRAVNSVLGRLAQSDPDSARKLVETLEPGRERAEAAKTVGNAWFEAAPEQASAWFLEQVPDSEVPAALRDITQRWLRRDPNIAGEWLSQFEPGEQSDPARAAFSQGIAGIDPASAVSWAETITNQQMREGSLVNIYKNWRMRDPAAAETAVRNSGLSEQQIEQAMQQP